MQKSFWWWHCSDRYNLPLPPPPYPLPPPSPPSLIILMVSVDVKHPVYLLQWSWFARVNALCNISRKKSREVAASLPGRFLSRRCLTLCITMEVKPRIAKQYKCHHWCSCKNYWEKGMEGGKNAFASFFWLTRRSRVHGGKCVLGHPILQATSYCLLPDTFWLRASKNVFKVGSVKFANSPSPLSIVKKVRTGSKSSKGI